MVVPGAPLSSGRVGRFRLERRLGAGVGLWAVRPDDAITRLCQAVTHPLCTAD